MRNGKVKLNSRRIFSDDFKKARVKEYEKGEFTVVELSRLFKIQGTIIYRWIHQYSTYNKRSIKIVEMADSGTRKVKELEDRIKELERIIGQKQLNIDYLETMIELAKEKFDIDIKKNSNTPQSNVSMKKDNK
jgi:transposase-like protein